MIMNQIETTSRKEFARKGEILPPLEPIPSVFINEFIYDYE